MTIEQQSGKRYLGMDIHRDYAVVVGVSAPNQIVMSARRIWQIEGLDACQLAVGG